MDFMVCFFDNSCQMCHGNISSDEWKMSGNLVCKSFLFAFSFCPFVCSNQLRIFCPLIMKTTFSHLNQWVSEFLCFCVYFWRLPKVVNGSYYICSPCVNVPVCPCACNWGRPWPLGMWRRNVSLFLDVLNKLYFNVS